MNRFTFNSLDNKKDGCINDYIRQTSLAYSVLKYVTRAYLNLIYNCVTAKINNIFKGIFFGTSVNTTYIGIPGTGGRCFGIEPRVAVLTDNKQSQ